MGGSAGEDLQRAAVVLAAVELRIQSHWGLILDLRP